MWALQARDAAVAMPLRVQRVDEVIRQLEAGDLKLRVRVLEVVQFWAPPSWRECQNFKMFNLDNFTIEFSSAEWDGSQNCKGWWENVLGVIPQAERAARRASIMQMATINVVSAVGLLNIGVTLSAAQGITAVSNGSFLGAGKPLTLHASFWVVYTIVASWVLANIMTESSHLFWKCNKNLGCRVHIIV